MTRRHAVVLLLLAALLLAGCAVQPTGTRPAVASPSPPTVTERPQPTAPAWTPTARPSATATAWPSATATAWPSATARPTATATATEVPRPAALSAAVELANQVDPERLMADVAWLADDARRGRLNGTPAEDDAGAWLADRFQALGLEPFGAAGLASYALAFPAVGADTDATPTPLPPGGRLVTAEDVVAVLPGTTRAGEYVVIGAHYDHIGVSPEGAVYNGADDNASGTAAVLEAARLLSSYAVQPQRTVVFVAFSAEEVGLHGAAALCRQLQAGDLAGQSRVLNLDVIGPPEGVDQSVHAWYQAGAQGQPLVDAAAWAGDALDVALVAVADDLGTDARAFWDCGVPAVSLTTGGERADHPYLHTPDDDPQWIDVEAYQDAVRVAVAALWLLANPE